MPERPILLLPESTAARRGKKGGGGVGPAKLGPTRQQDRLGARLAELERNFEEKRVQLQTTAAGFAPEDVLVLETAGSIEDFVKAVTRIGGAEFLLEYDEQDIPPDDDFFVERRGERTAYTGRVYAVFANQDAFRQLQTLWRLFQDGAKFATGLTKWRDVFGLLRDIRPWGMADRIEGTGVLPDWSVRVQESAEQVPCEIELWFRDSEQLRRNSSRAVQARVLELGGAILDESVIEGIRYHGLAVGLPVDAAQRILDGKTRAQVALVLSEQIQFFRAAGQMAAHAPSETLPQQPIPSGPEPSGSARVALLDGLPLQNHHALVNRLIVDDPDGYETGYRSDARTHGTAMASLVVWGDLNSPDPAPIPQPLYVRPIMRPEFPPDWVASEPYERVPEGTLVVDLIHRAVRRIFEATSDEGPAAPEVAVINFSIGIMDRPFSGTLSPLARLADWLSWNYGVLFVVSAGNFLHDIETGKQWSELQTLTGPDLAGTILQAVAGDTKNRRILSPAEAMNVLTVGALHQDDDTAVVTGQRLDPFPMGYPSPLNAHGLGYRRSIKPDLLVSGGRLQFIVPYSSSQTSLKPVKVAVAPGVQVAAPGASAGDLANTAKSRGTSNAAALLSRAAAFLAPVLQEFRQGEGDTTLAEIPDGVLIKALLAHGARWGELGSTLIGHLGNLGTVDKRTAQVTRLLGFGRLESWDVADCSSTRVTGIGGGVLSAGSGAEHRFPLPPSLSGRRGWRRLTVTLAWFTPINAKSHRWRKAHLWFETPRSKLELSRRGPDWQAAQRGTLQHNTFEGEAASAFVDGDDIIILVSCREDAPGLRDAVPYAIAVTLEVADEIGVDVYTEVRERVRQRLQVQPRALP